MQSNERQRQWEPDIIDIRRKPYPAASKKQENIRRVPNAGQITTQRRPDSGRQGSPRQRDILQEQIIPRRKSASGQQPGSARSRQAALQRRRKYIRRQRISIGIFIGCIVVAFCFLFLLPDKISAAGRDRENRITREHKTEPEQSPETFIQGLPATVFSSHPSWTEDFLTPNEFSRPGEALPEVKNIFVHYTANPGTSASQNRSYFEQQKDTHQVSVSAHFIIGYDGEILQCVPLDEIAYAVQSRNYDSVSIECCYKAEDGSFTQETYDSLISLLTWLTKAYELETEDILRHYDCGGKKCPLYYTEHPDAWERLKEDVAQAGNV